MAAPEETRDETATPAHKTTCRCASYNRPDRVRPTVSGTVPEVVLTPPEGLGDRPCHGVRLDACIARVVAHLWANQIGTLSSCCGHNRDAPSLVLYEAERDFTAVRSLIAEVDDRFFELYQWQLIQVAIPEAKDPGAPPLAAPNDSVKVTVSDPETGEVMAEQVIAHDYAVITAGRAYVHGVQAHANGTHIITVKKGGA